MNIRKLFPDWDDKLLRLCDSLHRNGYDRIYPSTVQPRLEVYRAEWTLRKDFHTLVEKGMLIRIGGPKARKGYRVAPEHRVAIQRSLSAL